MPPRRREISTFPVATQDVALIVDGDVPATDVEEALRGARVNSSSRMRLFDVFHRRADRRRARSPWRTRCASGRRTAR